MEALVENAAAPPSRFYCHSCAIEIDRVSSEFTCPHCLEGFIEELPTLERSGSAGSAAGQDADQATSDMEQATCPSLIYPFSKQTIRLDGELFPEDLLSPFLRRIGNQQGQPAGGAGSGNGYHALFTVDDIPMDGSSGVPSSGGASGGTDAGEGAASSSGAGGSGDTRPSFMRFAGRRGSRRRGVQTINHVDQILREILISVSGGATGGGVSGPMFFMGNPGDYAWGREGIDTIVTQLLNQMDNTGPPPLEKERIAQIPSVTISAEQVDQKLQCSVCFEDYVVGEPVRKLPCLHVYHDPCIIPWLELHGTCPICRSSLSPEDGHPGAQSQSPDNAQSPSDSTQQQQQHQQAASQPQSDSGRQNSNFLTFTIHDLLPTLSGPAMTNLLFEMGQPMGAGAASSASSSSLPPSAFGSIGATASGAAGTGTNANGGASVNHTNTTPGSTSTGSNGGNNGSQTSGQRDEDGTIDYTLELD
ncbi:E3 ubiquitin-protein ligase Iruka [Anopheles maculipalpis]|uniref:E3 ubiquitin-protein ligase Iruka n=1 Tax=Anopheles maculipalpis TaxID=1496333 RepID=UPI00215997AE|nr:E3 ubiquitin-protein ligase Iruka [Anopheles maculipalpis]